MPDDLAMIKDPIKWPNYPLLPLKKSNDRGWYDFGFLVADTKSRIFLGSMFEISDGKKVQDFPVKEYDSFEAIIQDGWIVD